MDIQDKELNGASSTSDLRSLAAWMSATAAGDKQLLCQRSLLCEDAKSHHEKGLQHQRVALLGRLEVRHCGSRAGGQARTPAVAFEHVVMKAQQG